MTTELHPITSKILDKASSIVQAYYSEWDENKVRHLIFKAVRDEEIKNQKLLMNFCELPADQQRNIWVGIFKNLIQYVPDKRTHKKIYKDCKKNMEKCITESCKHKEAES